MFYFKKIEAIDCNFSNSSFKHVKFQDANLKNANFKNAKFDQVHFSHSDLRGADIDWSTVDYKKIYINFVTVSELQYEACPLTKTEKETWKVIKTDIVVELQEMIINHYCCIFYEGESKEFEDIKKLFKDFYYYSLDILQKPEFRSSLLKITDNKKFPMIFLEGEYWGGLQTLAAEQNGQLKRLFLLADLSKGISKTH